MDEIHQESLTLLCRVCGQRCIKYPSSISAHGNQKTKYIIQIKNKYNIDIQKDIEDVDPKHICSCCIATFNQQRPSTRPVMKWTEHGPNCLGCAIIRSTRKGGRRPKPAKVAAKRRKEREDMEREKAEVKKACSTLLNSSYLATTNDDNQLKKVASAIIRNMLDDSNTVELPTGGPKMVLKKVSTPRKASHQASARTICRRNLAITEFIQEVSSPDAADGEEAAIHQLAALLKGKTKAELTKVIKDKGLLTIRIPAGEELAMKAKMGWSWSELRRLKRWLKAYNIAVQCEAKTRQLKGDILPYIKAEQLPFFKREGDALVTHLAPMVWVPNLTDHIMSTLDELESNNQLNWDNVKRDKERIWIKIGADKGGGSVKVYYQIMNVKSPNSPQNTIVFCAFAADETPPNLHIALDRYVPQINNLMKSQWSDIPIEVFLSGDLEILRKLLGLQGTSAKHPCVFCLAEKKNLKSDTENTPRTIEQIREDASKVTANGATAKAKQDHHSVNEEPFFDIPITHVCPPCLHINLGLWEKFFAELENDLQKLGQVIADDLARQDTDMTETTPYNKYVERSKETWKEITALRKQADEKREEMNEIQYSMVAQGLSCCSFEPSEEEISHTQKLQQEAQNLDTKADLLMKKNPLPRPINPFIQKLDDTLKDFKVRRHAFATMSFVGNHVKKCLKPENYNHLLEVIVQTTSELSSNDGILDLAESLRVKYLLLFDKFSSCHQGLRKASRPDEIEALRKDIQELVSYFASKFPKSSITPKFHILWQHVINFVQMTEVPLGIMGEQGGEHVHAQWNKLKRRLVGVTNTKKVPEVELMKAMMGEHLIIVHPQNRKLTEE